MSVGITRLVIESKSSGPNGQASQNAASAKRALASMSRPVRARANELRYPPSWFIATFRVGGGAWPLVPEMRTRSWPTWASSIVSNRAVTSGPRYSGPPISYSSCEVTVSTLTTPPVPSCLPMIELPSAATSAHGKPNRARPPTSS